MPENPICPHCGLDWWPAGVKHMCDIVPQPEPDENPITQTG